MKISLQLFCKIKRIAQNLKQIRHIQCILEKPPFDKYKIRALQK